MFGCRNCDCYRKKNLEGMSLYYKLTSVTGFCMDYNNPDFNNFAKAFGRGVGRFESCIKPKWCGIKVK